MPLPILYDLIVAALKQLLTALDKKNPDPVEINLIKKQCKLLHEAIVFVKVRKIVVEKAGVSLDSHKKKPTG